MTVRSVVTRGFGNGTYSGRIGEVVARGFAPDTADVTAPVLSSPAGVAIGANDATGSVVTDEGNGTLYFWATENASESATNIKASGDSQAVTGTGTQNVSVSGLTAETGYYLHYVHDDDALNESNVVSSAAFTTEVEPVTDTPSGGYTYLLASDRRRTREDIRAARRRLGIEEDDKDIEEKAAEAVQKAAVATLNRKGTKPRTKLRDAARKRFARARETFIEAVIPEYRLERTPEEIALLKRSFDEIVQRRAKVLEELEMAEITAFVVPQIVKNGQRLTWQSVMGKLTPVSE